MLETLLSLVRNDWNVFPTTSFPPFAACNLTEVPPGLADDLPWVLVAFVHLDGNLRVYMIYTIYTHSHIVPIFHIFLPWLEKDTVFHKLYGQTELQETPHHRCRCFQYWKGFFWRHVFHCRRADLPNDLAEVKSWEDFTYRMVLLGLFYL